MMIELKISKTVAKSYQAREMAGFPKEEGIHQVGDTIAIIMRGDAYEQWKTANTPIVKAAFDGLYRQIDKGLMPPEKVEADVSLRNIDEKFVILKAEEIQVLDQVRSNFDDEAVQDLADDIAEYGLINPITVRLSHPSNKAFKYILVAGERRMRACMMAGHPIIAQVIDVSEARARSIQFAENIHREDLSIADKARAVRWIYDELGTMQAVADLVKKSKSWVSKLVAVSEPDFGFRARALLEDGVSEDLELLGILSQIEKHHPWEDAEDAAKRIRSGKINREQARKLLQTLKNEAEEEKRRIDEASRKPEKTSPVDQDLKAGRDEEKKAREELERAERRKLLEEDLRLDPLQVLRKLVKFYVLTEERTFDGDSTEVAIEFSTMPYAGTGSDEEIKQTWRTAIESLAEHMGEPVTLEYFNAHN